MTDDQVPVSAADLERLAGRDELGDSPVGAALSRSREALRAWGAAASDPSDAPAMPGDVAERLDAVLAAARADVAPGVDGGTMTTLPTLLSRRNPNRNRFLSIAAAIVVIAGVGTAIGVASGGSHKKHLATSLSTPNGGHLTLPADIPVVTTDTNYATIDAVRQSVKALVTGALPAAPTDVAAAVRAAASAAANGTAAAADSAAGAASVPGPAAPQANAGAKSAPTRSALDGTPLSADLVGGDLAVCLQHLADGQQIVGIERALYKGQLSLIVAIRDASVLNAVDIFIVGKSCDGLPADGSGVRDTAQVQLS